MDDIELKPTHVGKNKGLIFKTPMELFRKRGSPDKKLDPEIKKELSKHVKGTFGGLQIANMTYKANVGKTKTETTPEFWDDFEKRNKELGVDLVGYTPIDENYVFQNFKIYGKNAIVLGMEMVWERIKTAPGPLCNVEAFRVYKELGDITIELIKFLQEEGYKAEAHHPFGGKLLFPPHAVAAGLGIKGRNGLVITPEFGPRQRWSVISTDAEIPQTVRKDFSEMEEFCKTCGSCVKNCEGGAAFEEPIEKVKGSGVITHIDRSKCIYSLINNNYCSVCLKVCPKGHPKK